MARKERLYYLDFVRAIATVLIVLTHFNALFLFNVYAPEKAVITTRIANVYIGDVGVSLFLIISGASLMYVYGDDKLDLKKFYTKRFFNLYPMFWIGYGIAFLYNFYKLGTIQPGIPKINIIYSLLGIDTYVTNFGIPTFALIGEWFIGLILMIYIVFPLLKIAIDKMPVVLAIILIILYLISVYTRGASIDLLTRLPEFAFGMYFVKYIKKVNWKLLVPCIFVLVVNTVFQPTIHNCIQTAYVGVCSFLFLVFIADYLKFTVIKNLCRVISKYSYACFLVHHYVIYQIMNRFDLANISRGASYLSFLLCALVITILSYLLYQADKNVKNLFKKEM